MLYYSVFEICMKASLRSRQVPKHDRGVGRQGHRGCRLRPPHNTWPRASLGNRGRDDIISRGRDLGSLISGLATPARRKVRVAVENIPTSNKHSPAGALQSWGHGDRSITDCALCAPPPQYFTSCS